MAATRSLNSPGKKKPIQPFYEVPNFQTSAKIIQEARRLSVRTLAGECPHTPADGCRALFGHGASQSRPSSVYSTIGAHHFSDEGQSRPATGQRPAPIKGTLLGDSAMAAKKKVLNFHTCCVSITALVGTCSNIFMNLTYMQIDITNLVFLILEHMYRYTTNI